MTVADLVDLYQYGAWATNWVLRVASDLSSDDFTTSVAGSYGSVRDTLVHALSAQWGWVARCGGSERGPALKSGDFPTVESVAELARSVEERTSAFLATLTDSDLERFVTYSGTDGESRSFPAGELLYHAANHGVHHRGQIAILLRELGHTPGNFDILFYYAERRGVRVW